MNDKEFKAKLVNDAIDSFAGLFLGWIIIMIICTQMWILCL